MANKKRRRRKQGVVSWATSIIALAIGLSGVAHRFKMSGLSGVADQASFGMLRRDGKFNLAAGLQIYAPMIGGLIFKKLASELVKAARIQSLVPRIG